MEKKWYVIHTYSGYENKVKTNIEKKIDSMAMEDKIFQILSMHLLVLYRKPV